MTLNISTTQYEVLYRTVLAYLLTNSEVLEEDEVRELEDLINTLPTP